MPIDPEYVALGKQAAPGVIGSLTAIRYTNGPLLARITMVPSGAFLSFYAGPWVASKMGMPEGLSGFLVGLFGMVVVGKLFETWDRFDLSSRFGRLFDRWFGTDSPPPPNQGGPQP